MISRRKAIKSLMALGAISVSPQILLGRSESNPQTHFVGLGNSGCQIVQHFLKQDPKDKFTCLSYFKPKNLDSRIQYIHIPPTGKVINDFGEPHHITSNSSAKVELTNEALELFNADDKFVLLTGLGGFTGSNLAKELTLKLHASNKDFRIICSLPFKFEGTNRRNNALKALNAIDHLPQVKYLELDHLREKYDDLVLNNCFERGDWAFWEVYIKSYL